VDRLRNLTTWHVIAFAALLALALGAFQLAHPHVLGGELGYNLGYDDGVYFGAAMRFVHGAAAYRDFTIVHPPGVIYLLSPFALFGEAVGSRTALELARIATVVVTAANVALVGYLVRSRGRVATAVASLALAAWPLTVAIDRTVELEPYLVLFTLLGAVLLVDDTGRLATGRRLVWAGIWFGLAFDIKVWAVLPILAAALVLLRRPRAVVRFLAGVTAAVAVVCGPFFALAPRAFWHDVVADQLGRHDTGVTTTIGERLRLLTGVSGLPGVSDSTALAVVVLVVILAATVAVFVLSSSRPAPVDVLVLALWLVIGLGMFASAGFFDHYAYFPAVPMAALVGVLVAGLRRELRLRRPQLGRPRLGPAFVGVTVIVAAVLFVEQARFAHRYLTEASDPSVVLAAAIPKGACVFDDFPTDLILAGRYAAANLGCPQIVDPFGLFLADDNGRTPHLEPPPFDLDFVAEWQAWLMKTDYVVLRIPYSDFVPFNPDLLGWFAKNYHLVLHVHHDYPDGYIDKAKDEFIYARNKT
jgi:alpha-1,2-mannosyltransferase